MAEYDARMEVHGCQAAHDYFARYCMAQGILNPPEFSMGCILRSIMRIEPVLPPDLLVFVSNGEVTLCKLSNEE